jgi:hypothetical protein
MDIHYIHTDIHTDIHQLVSIFIIYYSYFGYC